jgi:hypothetical protein
MNGDCIYTININGKKVSMNLMELTEHFYKTTDKLKRSDIYSSDEKVEATRKILGKFITKEYRESLKKDVLKIDVLDFVTKELPQEILETLEFTGQTRLNPEYIEENRIKEWIKLKTLSGEDVPNVIDHERLAHFMALPELSNLPREKVNFHLTDILDTIALEEKTKKLGSDLHKALKNLISYEGDFTHSVVASSIKSIYSNNQEILSGNEVAWINKFETVLYNIYQNFDKFNYVMSEVPVGTMNDSSMAQLKGTLDVLAIDDNGSPQIYDFKISKKPFRDWDLVKLQQTDWQLVLYRQLLSQYLPVENTTINILPIEVGDMVDGKLLPINFIVSTPINRIISYKFESIAQKLIPRKVFISYDPEKRQDYLDDLKLLFDDSYEIKTSSQDDNVERIVQSAKKRGRWSFSNDFDLESEGIKKGINTIEDLKASGEYKTEAEKETEFRKKIEIYVARLKEHKTKNVREIKHSIASAINSEGGAITRKVPEEQAMLNKVLKDYINGTHKIIEVSDDVSSLGFILLENITNGRIVVVDITAYNKYASAEFNKDLLFEDVEYVKTFAFLNRFYDDLGLNRTEIEEILIINPDGRQLGTRDLSSAFNTYIKLVTKKKISNKLTQNNIPNLQSRVETVIKNLLRSYKGKNYNGVESVFKVFFDENVHDMSYEKALNIEKAVLEAFPRLKEKEMLWKSGVAFEDDIEYLYAMLQQLIFVKSGQTLHGDFLGMRDFSFAFSDFKSLFAAFYTKDQEEYTKDHKKITGIMGSLMLITPDKVPSNDLRSINKIIQVTNNLIRQNFIKQSSKLQKLTRDFYKNIGYTNFEQNFWGQSRSKYKNMFRTTKSGDVSEEMKVKNPYDNNSLLTDIERKYLKSILFEIQRYLLNISDSDAAKIDISTLEAIEKTDSSGKIMKAIFEDKYFDIPLVRSEQLDKYGKVLFGGIQGIARSMKDNIGEFNNLLNVRELTEEDLSASRATQAGLHEMYDVYSRQTTASKLEAIKRHKTMDYWELNLDTIAHKVAFNKIRKNFVDKKLPIIKSYIWTMKLLGGRTNEDMSKELKYVERQLKLGLFDEAIIEEEFGDVTKVAAVIKRITTVGMLALRPVLMAKEMTIGLFKGFSLASTKMFGEELFDSKSLASALTKLATIDKKFSQEWNLIDRINHHYAFANLDMGSYSNRVKTDRRGIMKGLSPWLYAFNTIPDYYNRMALFLAKMIYDGSYEAHTLVDGNIVYDPKKDKRFSYYLENRDKYKDSKGNFIPAPKDEKYNRQRNLYILLIQQVNTDRAGLIEPYTEKDLVDVAYSELERNSFKSLTDTAYGYYDKDAQSQLHNTAFGVIFLQFMQYWPGKMQLWFGKPTKPEDSPIGKYVQKKRLDENGVEKLLWREAIYDEITGEFTGEFKDTFENTGDPWLAWEGIPQEGLAYAVAYTIQDILTGKGKAALSNRARIHRVEYAMLDALLLVLFWGFIVALIKGYVADFGRDSVGGELLAFAEATSKKILHEQNLFQNTVGAIRTEPAFYTYTTQVAGDIEDLIMGDTNFRNSLSKNLKMFEFLQE